MLAIEPSRSPITAALPPGAVIPGYAANVQGRLAATPEHMREIVDGNHVAFVYAHADGTIDDGRNPERLGARLRRR